MEELLKCPFCGGEAGIASESAVYSIMYFVMCRKCTGRSGYTPSVPEAIAAWNRRTQNIGKKECSVQEGYRIREEKGDPHQGGG